MDTKITGLAAVLFIASLASPAVAWYKNGNNLYELLKAAKRAETSRSTPDGIDGVYGIGYVVGVSDVIRDVVYCASDRVTVGQIWAVVFAYLDAHPEQRHEAASVLVAKALGEKFPCK